MRTTLSISDELLTAAKEEARQKGVALGTVVDAALRRYFAEAPEIDRPAIPVFRGGDGPRPGVDLTSNRALQEILDAGTDLTDLR